MVGRVSKVLAGVGLAATVIAAGAGGVAWFSAQKASVADGRVVQESPPSSASPAGGLVATPTASPATIDLEFGNPSAAAPVPMRTDEWILQENARLEEFPLEADFLPSLSCMSTDFPDTESYSNCLKTKQGCSDRQLTWLRANATLTAPRLLSFGGRIYLGEVSLKNTSKSNQAISFKNVRSEISVTPVSDAGASVLCSSYNDWYGGATAGQSQFREILLPSKGGIGVFGPSPSWGEDLTRNIAEGSPAVINLGAGESAQVLVSAAVGDAVGTISGRVIAVVSAADGERDIDVPLRILSQGPATFSTAPRPTWWINGGAPCPRDITRNKLYTLRAAKACTVQQFKAANNLG